MSADVARSVPRLYGKMDESTPGSWWRLKNDDVEIKCSTGHCGTLAKRFVASKDGVVYFQCQAKDCDFEGNVRLEGWR